MCFCTTLSYKHTCHVVVLDCLIGSAQSVLATGLLDRASPLIYLHLFQLHVSLQDMSLDVSDMQASNIGAPVLIAAHQILSCP